VPNIRDACIVVTLDVGGSAAKASAFDAVKCAHLASASEPYPAADDGDPGVFDPEAWWAAAARALGSLTGIVDAAPGRYLGVVVSAIRIPFVLVDRDGDPVLPGLLNKDRRALPNVAEVTAAIGADDLYRTTGHWPAAEFGLPKLLWIRSHHPAPWSRTAALLQLHDWFIYRLSGVMVSEPSSAAMSQMLDVAKRAWAADVLGAFGIGKERFPELRPAGSRVGGVLDPVAHATGLPAGLPVHLGGGDTHLSAMSAGTGLDHVPVVVAGTTAPVQLAVDALSSQPDCYPLLVSEHAIPGLRALETNAGPTGGILAHLAGLHGEAGDSLAEEVKRRGFEVTADADAPLTVLSGNPFFGAEGWAMPPPPTIVGLRPGHRGSDIVHAGLAGTCYAIRSILDPLDEHSAFSSPRVLVTGGMAQNAEWCQLLADVCEREIAVRPLDRISGLAGAALVADCESSQMAAEVAEVVFFPDQDPEACHTSGFGSYLDLYRTAQVTARDNGLSADACPR
jgi:sugar (pentulose or hexulose) kinase